MGFQSISLMTSVFIQTISTPFNSSQSFYRTFFPWDAVVESLLLTFWPPPPKQLRINTWPHQCLCSYDSFPRCGSCKNYLHVWAWEYFQARGDRASGMGWDEGPREKTTSVNRARRSGLWCGPTPKQTHLTPSDHLTGARGDVAVFPPLPLTFLARFLWDGARSRNPVPPATRNAGDVESIPSAEWMGSLQRSSVVCPMRQFIVGFNTALLGFWVRSGSMCLAQQQDQLQKPNNKLIS